MVTVLMVQPAVDQIIHMIAMRHSFVPAAWSMNMTLFMTDMVMQRMASIRVGFADFDDVLIDMIAMRVMQMAIVEIIHVIAMFYGGVAAADPVLMVMVVMMRQIAVGHCILPPVLPIFDHMIEC
jgi:hypothetical protein